MSSPRLFCPAFRLGTNSDSIRTSSHVSSKKRERSEVDPDEVSEAYRRINKRKQNLKGESLPASKTPGQATTVFARDVEEAETTQDSNSSDSESGTSEAASAPLASPRTSWRRPSPGGRPVSGPPRSDGLRQQHLAAVSAILHRCLLQGDYLRASRAWALLLRSEVNGHSMDVRRQNRWGIGAEILLQESLLQRDRLRVDECSKLEDYNETSTKNTKSRYTGLSRPAQDYYDRLIVQYPHRKRFTSAIGPLEFYPALFGLRIFSEQHDHEDHLRSIQEKCSDDDDNMTDETSPEKGSHSPGSPDSVSVQITNLLDSSVTRGKEMINQLDELLSSPPYSDDHRLQKLRSMIDLWIEDILASPHFKNTPEADHQRDT